MKALIVIQAAICLFAGIGLLLGGSTQSAVSFIEGAGMVLLNFLFLSWAWKNILAKKLVALAVSLIVFKYAIFALIIYLVLRDPDSDKVWFLLGLGTLMTSILGYLFFINFVAGKFGRQKRS